MTGKERTLRFRMVSKDYSDSSILMHEAIARKAGLSGTDHKYLGFIVERGKMTAGELSKLSSLTTGAVTGLIDRLEKKKLVKREFVKDDRRKVIIVANVQTTNKIMDPLFKELQEKTSKLISSFSAKEFEIIEKYFVEATKIMKETQQKLSKK